MLDLLQYALLASLNLRTCFVRWNEIARALREPPRRRTAQPGTWPEIPGILS